MGRKASGNCSVSCASAAFERAERRSQGDDETRPAFPRGAACVTGANRALKERAGIAPATLSALTRRDESDVYTVRALVRKGDNAAGVDWALRDRAEALDR